MLPFNPWLFGGNCLLSVGGGKGNEDGFLLFCDGSHEQKGEAFFNGQIVPYSFLYSPVITRRVLSLVPGVLVTSV